MATLTIELPPVTRISDAEYTKPDIEFRIETQHEKPVLFVKVIDELIPTAVFVDDASVDRFIMAVNALSRRREELYRRPA